MTFEEKARKKLAELKISLERIQANANAHIGAMQAIEDLLKEESKEEKVEEKLIL